MACSWKGFCVIPPTLTRRLTILQSPLCELATDHDLVVLTSLHAKTNFPCVHLSHLTQVCKMIWPIQHPGPLSRTHTVSWTTTANDIRVVSSPRTDIVRGNPLASFNRTRALHKGLSWHGDAPDVAHFLLL